MTLKIISNQWLRLTGAAKKRVGCFVILLLLSGSCQAERVLVAVAANFNAAMNRLIPVFNSATGHQLVASYGSTGKLYAQIIRGAPYQLFLSADNSRTGMIIEAGVGVPDSTVVYAIGQLVLWSADAELINGAAKILTDKSIRRIALANPKTAPYGTAAFATLTALDLQDQLSSKLVQAESIAQAFQFAATRNADLAFVALSQLRSGQRGGSSWLVSEDLYSPIIQEAVLLNNGRTSKGAIAFMDFLTSAKAADIIRQTGYKLPADDTRGD